MEAKKRRFCEVVVPDVYGTKKRRLSSEPMLAPEPVGETQTELAMKTMKKYYDTQIGEITVPRLVLQTQVYALVSDRTQVDKELNELQRAGIIRMFKIPVSADEYSYCFMEDFHKIVDRIKAEIQNPENVSLLENFVEKVILQHSHVSITAQGLRNLMEDPECNILELVSMGFLVQVNDVYLFTVPGSAKVYAPARAVRTELMTMMNRQPFKEILLSRLEKKRLKKSRLGMLFHVHDMVGANILVRRQTTSGDLVAYHPQFKK
eukprot:TRINITY_DN6322_c0_g1_i1.p1 TRINITY_DN6322_c0_g1~~TRINITY_DN6322_c0_g1_i1.p1  ORF type:complete len:263 (-),score=38.35 TRINITY_DN6322_c0_g1_i1:82-870(-)